MRTLSVMVIAGILLLAPAALTPTGAQDGQAPSTTDDTSPSGPSNSGSGSDSDSPSSSGSSACDADCQRRQAQDCRRRADDGETFEQDDLCARQARSGAGSEAADHTDGNQSTSSGKSADDRRQAYREQWERRAEEERRAQQAAAAEQKARRDSLPLNARDLASGFLPDETGYQGRFVTFLPDRAIPALYNLNVTGTPLFDSIVAPSELDASRAFAKGNTIDARGDGWRLRLVDHPSASLRLESDDGPFVITLPEGTSVEPVTDGLLLGYPRDTNQPRLMGTLTGNVTATDDALVYLVDGDARFFVSAKRVILQEVANKVRPDLEKAMSAGQLGAEMSVLKGAKGIVNETIAFEDMEVHIQPGAVDPAVEGDGVYTITVDSASHDGKTIVVNLEAGIVDPERLIIRYFNVDENGTVEATIRQASSLEDVLDSSNDGVVAEWWHVSSADGDAYLMSIPHFSVHQIQLQTIGEVIVEQPALVLGIVGAVLLVGVATGGMLRKPKD